MISFTRTAVHEIRSRLTTLLEDAGDAASVRIATLDSMAWTLHSGFSKDAVLTGSYDDNIAQTLVKIRENPDVREEFGKVRHIVIDEAQDIVGIRAELVLAIIDAVAQDCGVTVFADQAQAIYGFTEDDAGQDGLGLRLLKELEDREFRSVSLSEVHRTDSPALLTIFTQVRSKVLDSEVPALARGVEIRTEIERLADASIGPAKELKLTELPPHGLVLMRQRSDVLLASSFNQGVPHRLRMSGLPVRILPWPAVLLWDHVERRLTKDVFDRRWTERLTAQPGTPSPEAAWQLLFETAGESATVIDLHRLRTVLGRSNPPSSFTSPEYGDGGPIIGTIHASKGREAEEVRLYLPPLPDEEDEHIDADEEVRVMFVGATRARRKLSIGNTTGKRLGKLDGRFWKEWSGGTLQVEIGRTYDIDSSGLVGSSTFKTASDALDAQRWLMQTPVSSSLFARESRDLGWNFELQAPGEVRIGALAAKVKADLRDISNLCEKWPPPKHLPHIRSLGLRSIVLRADDAAVDQLHEPWRTSGFLLAPMILGVCMTRFKG
jgi:superfamily I DNA/RNA helicase